MKNIDPNSLIILSKVFNELSNAEAAALIAVMALPTVQHKIIAEKFSINPKAITRATSKAAGAALLHGKAGAWTVVLPQVDGLASADDNEPDAGVKMAAEFHRIDRESRTWKSKTYRSRLERDTAFILSTIGIPFTYEVPYKKFITTDRDWTCDFIVEVELDPGLFKIGIECTGRADARATLTEKVTACSKSNFPLIVIDSASDLVGLRSTLKHEREKATARALAAASTSGPIDTTKPHMTASGRYIDPRAVKPLGYRPPPPLHAAPPFEPRVLTADQIRLRELARAEEALEEQEYETEKAAVAEFRQKFRDEVEAPKVIWTDDERAKTLTAALRVRGERDRARPVPARDEPNDDNDCYDPEVEGIARAEGCDDTIDIERGEV